MFTGIDEVDWASLRHGYGSAEDVPRLLRGLASADTVERQTALDGLYGAVHHEGQVYDSTLACVPFLFALVAREDVPDRAGVVELLVSIGAGGGRGAGGRGGVGDREGTGGGAPARDAVSAGAGVFVPLTADPDARVRRVAADALVRFLDGEPARVLDLLRRRLLVERDDRVLLAVTGAVGLFARRHPGHATPALDLLAARSTPPYGPGARLAALGQLARAAPGRLPADLVPTAVRLLRERSAQRAVEPGRPQTDTLAARIRRLRPSDEEGSRLLRTLHDALGDRVNDRIALLTGQLTSPDPRDRGNGVWMSAALFRGRRADYGRPVTLLGAQLDSDHTWLCDAAVSVLTELFGLATPAADALHTLVTARPDLWTRRWDGGPPTLGGPLRALARSGDRRAVPVLAQVLESAVGPVDLGCEVVHLGRAAAPLAPALRHRLGRVPLDDPATARLARPLLTAIGSVADREAVPEVLRLLSGGPDGLGARDAIAGQVIETLETLGAASEAAPLLRRFLHTRHAAEAAGALWSAEGDATAVLPCLRSELAEDRRTRRRPAAQVLGRLGPAARPALPELRRAAVSGRAPERAEVACAWWRIEGDPEPVLPVLRTAWTDDPAARGPIARCLAEMGPSAAALRDLVATELGTVRRHTAREVGHGSHDIAEDEALLMTCREVMAGI